MRTYEELGPTPVEEDALQAGFDPIEDIKAECRRYLDLLKRVCPIPTNLSEMGVYYYIKRFPYDPPVDCYYEVCISFDDDDEEQCDWVFNVLEPNLPLTWEG